MKKVFFTSFLAVLLAVSTTAYGVLGSKSSNVAYAESLADVNLLKDVQVEAELGNVEGDDPYTLHLKMTGTGLADVELVNPENNVIFYAEELAENGKWHPEGKAHVEAELLPLRIEDLSGLGDAVSGLTSGLLNTVTEIVDTLDSTLVELAGSITGNEENEGIINVTGKDGLLTTVQGLTDGLAPLLSERLVEALNDVTVYKDDIEVVVGEHGELKVNFTDGLGERLEGIVDDVVLGVVEELKNTINELDLSVNLDSLGERLIPDTEGLVSGLLSDVLDLVGGTLDEIVDPTVNALLDDLLHEVVGGLLAEVSELVDGLTDAVLELLNKVVTLQVLGETTIDLDLTVDKPVGIDGDVKVYGEAVKDSMITLDVLSSFVNYDIITFNEAEETTPPAEDPEPEEPKKPEKPEKPELELPDTATAAGAIGLTGLTALIAGMATRFFGRKQ